MNAAPTGAEQRLHGHLLAVALEAAAEAVDLIHTNRPIELSVEAKSSATDHVTQMDRASESLIRSIIVRHRPDDRIVGEEEGDSGPGDSGVTWYVDPIDGTTNYVYDHPGYAVSIAAVIDGVGTVAAVVADPTHGRTYSGGAGAVRRLRRQTVCGSRPPPVPMPPAALVATGFGYDAERRGRQGEVVARAAAPDPRHPSHGRRRGRPVLGRVRSGRRLLRGRAGDVGPRRRRVDRRGGGRPARRTSTAVRSDRDRCSPHTRICSTRSTTCSQELGAADRS